MDYEARNQGMLVEAKLYSQLNQIFHQSDFEREYFLLSNQNSRGMNIGLLVHKFLLKKKFYLNENELSCWLYMLNNIYIIHLKFITYRFIQASTTLRSS